MKQQVGLIGAGNIAETQYLPALATIHGEKVWVYDNNPSRIALLQKKFNIQPCTLSEIKQQADTIFITTPPDSHYQLLKQLLPTGKKLICEKPFVLSLEEAVELNTLAQQYQSRLLIAHIRRLYPAIELAKDFISNNQLQIKKVDLYEGNRFSYKASSGYTTNHPAGGVLADTGSHVLDCLLYLTGWETEVLTIDIQYAHKDKEEPSHAFEAKLSLNEIPVTIKLSRYETLANKINMYSDKGILEIPLGLKPFVKFTTPTGHQVLKADPYPIHYVGEAFKAEINYMLNEDGNLFDASRFVNLTTIIEQLNQYATVR